MNEIDGYHEGERAVQQRLGEEAVAAQNSRIVANGVMPTAIQFIAQQPMIVMGSVHRDGQPWASLFFGEPGFVMADDMHLFIDRANMLKNQNDVFWHTIQSNQSIGTQVIELSSRRRVRLNGSVISVDENLVVIDVDVSYPNCPKYIQCRNTLPVDITNQKNEIMQETGTILEGSQRGLIERTDIMFVASHHPRAGVDVSHRGGNPGFMNVLDEKTIRVADYPGNSMFNTLGNFASNPVAGIVVPDFTAGTMLQLTGDVEMQWNLPDEGIASGGTNRFWDLRITEWIETKNALPSGWELLEVSPFNP